jgi:hypothetical protein
MKAALKTPYIVLICLLGGCFLSHYVIPAQFAWLKGFFLDMASEIVGILLVVFSIDRVIAIEQAKEKRQLETVACSQLRRPLLRHFYLLFNLFKASISQKPDKDYQQVSDLFDETYYQEIAYLDFAQSAPVIALSEARWIDYLTQECKQFQESLHRTTEKYALFLPPDILDLVEEMINDPFIWLVLQSQTIRQLGNRELDSKPYPFLARREVRELLREYLQKFLQLLTYYNEHVPEEKQILLADDLWNNEVPPKIGSARTATETLAPPPAPETTS